MRGSLKQRRERDMWIGVLRLWGHLWKGRHCRGLEILEHGPVMSRL